jgi:short-subunit dehydrogenase
VAAKAIVTGASSGIGLELAKLAAQAGYDVALVARSQENLDRAAAGIAASFGVGTQAIALDLTLPQARANLFERVSACDLLVNNAGFANNGFFATLPEADVLEEIALDVAAVAHLTRRYLPGMLERKSGKVLNVASTAAFVPGPNMAVYYASKAFVVSFSEAIADEVRGTGVTVTVLCPGATRTGFQERAQVEQTLLIRLPLADPVWVAKAGFEGMMRGKTVVVPGFVNKLVAVSPRFSPRKLVVWLSRKAVERRA